MIKFNSIFFIDTPSKLSEINKYIGHLSEERYIILGNVILGMSRGQPIQQVAYSVVSDYYPPFTRATIVMFSTLKNRISNT